jgi:hypothetical protein
MTRALIGIGLLISLPNVAVTAEPYLYFNAYPNFGFCHTGVWPGCAEAVAQVPLEWVGPTIQVDVFLEYGDLLGAGEVRLQVSTENVEPILFQGCTGGPVEFDSSWPDSGSVVTVRWANDCVGPDFGPDGIDNVNHLGYFLVPQTDEPASLWIDATGSEGSGTGLDDCDGIARSIVDVPILGLGGALGQNPCPAVPTLRSTWANVKASFR